MSVFNQMLARYEIKTETDRRNASYEIMQEIALAGLYRSGFFEQAAFYGGTCLRIFHGMNRFSEDLDFSLLRKDNTFNIESYFPSIIDEFKTIGREVSLTKKEKKNRSTVESAFLKENTTSYDLSFSTEKQLKIKIEVDVDPPLGFSTEYKLLLHPFSFMTRCFSLPDLFAGKMHALIFRTWKTRVKGRDWYDFEWYVKKGIALNFSHFQERAKQFNGMTISLEDFKNLLKDRLINTDINLVKNDVKPFLKNHDSLDIWSIDYFIELSKMICIL